MAAPWRLLSAGSGPARSAALLGGMVSFQWCGGVVGWRHVVMSSGWAGRGWSVARGFRARRLWARGGLELGGRVWTRSRLERMWLVRYDRGLGEVGCRKW